jgi:hypothetical protein
MGLIPPTDYLILDRYRQRAAAISYVKAEIICGEGAMIEVARFEDKTV